MHDLPILSELVIVLTTAGLVVWIFQRLKMPPILGYLAAGVLVGPAGFGLIHDHHNIEVMAEIGVVLLLFTIGLEFSVKDLLRMRKIVFGAGPAQLLLTAGSVAGAFIAFGMSWQVAVFVGLITGVSSTAIVLKLLGDRGELSALHGRITLGILLFQDLSVVALMLVAPLLAGQAGTPMEALWSLGKAILVIAGIFVGANLIVPFILERVVKTRSRELFTITTVVGVLGTAYLAGMAGLSLAIGAFVAGMVISESRYSHQMLSEMLPLKDVFNGVFFVSVGMLVEPGLIVEQPLMILGMIAAVVVVKGALASGVAWILGYGSRMSIIAGANLAQIGEFGLVLAAQGAVLGLLTTEHHGIFVAVTVGTMVLTPFMMLAAEKVTAGIDVPQPLEHPPGMGEGGDFTEKLDDHVIIVGYGINGRNVAAALQNLGVPFVVTELNPNTVANEAAAGIPIVYGDASGEHVLEHVGIDRAHTLVVAIADPTTVRQIVVVARRRNPDLNIIVRTRYVHEVDDLFELGADDVVPEEFETSIELMGLVMLAYGAERLDVLEQKEALRRMGYASLRDRAKG